MNIHDATDYIIVQLTEGGVFLNVLKLQKLLYYCQAWSLAFNRGRLFPDSSFQAWVHGPVSREVYDRFLATKALYSSVNQADVREGFNPETLRQVDRAFINSVLEVYAPLTGDQLEEMTHREDPWLDARAGVSPSARSENAISDEIMQRYYAKRLEAAHA
ncbi:putative phage-associated protein [Phyllobacterium myrsinacearum]|uniref:Panacea domain-containing protein n=1 Tax=Phyllobacterium myrsinacearum TaxID=28101 RepID=UPI0010296B7A|nr:type II toxin-antitoxin system antitoxin SocA domain-containing protein [Phyllobacterium myrsinacearum]RZS82049.1 putative phage-associated protein [Phyllobacterium myrsinacearum]